MTHLSSGGVAIIRGEEEFLVVLVLVVLVLLLQGGVVVVALGVWAQQGGRHPHGEDAVGGQDQELWPPQGVAGVDAQQLLQGGQGGREGEGERVGGPQP